MKLTKPTKKESEQMNKIMTPEEICKDLKTHPNIKEVSYKDGTYTIITKKGIKIEQKVIKNK